MRVNLLHPDAAELRYEIRDVTNFAQRIAQTGIEIVWENIGDPIDKGEEVPKWIRDIVASEAQRRESYSYSAVKGLTKTREFLAATRSRETGTKLEPDNIFFFNGLADAVNKLYTWLNPSARVLGPNPAYPTHSYNESVHGHSPMLTYKLDPKNNWWPDIEDVRRQVGSNPNITALLIVNPDNPTGMVYPSQILVELVNIAREYNLFLIADEIYARLAFDDSGFVSLANEAQDIPTIIARGLSKEMPWPGGRCGWLEFYNTHSDENFAAYVKSILKAKLDELPPTLPQVVLPSIMSDPRYSEHLQKRREKYARRAREATQVLNAHPDLNVVAPKGALYLSVTFSEQLRRQNLKIPAANPIAQKLLDEELAHIPESDFDKRFCYQLMASTGICTVPLSTGFNSHVPGFRMTLLEPDDLKFSRTLQKIYRVIK